MDQKILQALAPKAQQMLSHAALMAASPQSRRISRKEQKAREDAIVQQLWAEAHRQGLTSFAVPPILVSLFCRALWQVVLYYLQKVLSEYEPGK